MCLNLTFLYRYLAIGSSFKTLGYSFRISDVTVGRIIEACEAIWNNLHSVHMPLPKNDEAYPLKTYLMRPFPASKLGPEETIFNERLS